MTLRQALYHRLSTYTTLTAIIPATRIYWVKMPQGVVYPAVTFQVLPTAGRVHLMTGDDSLVMEDIRVAIWGMAGDYSSMESAIDAVTAALEGFKGTMGGAGGITVDWTFVESNAPATYEAGAEVYTIQRDFTIWYYE